MMPFDASWIQQVTGGRWLRPPAGPLQVAAVGIDTREELRDRAFVAIRGERFDGHDFLTHAAAAGAALLIVEPGRAATLPAGPALLEVASTREALGRIAAAHRRRLSTLRVIAVTGSSGKTTTKRLIDAVLSTTMRGAASPKSFNNEIGVPLTLLSATERDEYLVVEIGMNRPGEIAALAALAEPDVAVITMVGSAHLGGLGSVEAIAREKASIVRFVRTGGAAIVHDSPVLDSLLQSPAPIQRFGESTSASVRMVTRTADADGQNVTLNDGFRFRLNIPGRHNASNAIAAVAVGRALGVSDASIAAGLARATPAPMRLERRSINGIELFNDAYNANPESMAAALDTFGEVTAGSARRVVILGDMLELGDASEALHEAVGRRVVELHRHHPLACFVAVGRFCRPLAAAAELSMGGDRVLMVPELTDSACAMIADRIHPGDRVLLKASRGTALERLIPYFSPAAATAAH